MSTIVTRAGKGSTLTFAEVDANFTNLNTDKLEFSSEPVRHSVRPSLLLDFANTKQLDPRITFTRASTATFYDGRTTAKAEENLLLQSQAFDNASWTKLNSAVVTANSTVAPDGTTTADTVDDSSNGVFRGIQQTWSSISGSIYTGSIFVRKTTGALSAYPLFQVAFNAQSIWAGLIIDTTNGTSSVVTAGGYSSPTASSIVAVGDYWRVAITITSTGTGSSTGFEFYPAASTNGTSLDATATGTAVIWGAQLEQRSSVTAYTPTTTAAITNYIPALQTAASGVARFDHNPTTGESLGLLIEEQRVNLLTYSEQIDNGAWSKSNCTVTANQVVAPDGLLTSDFATTSAANSGLFKIETIAANAATYTASIYVKYLSGSTSFRFRLALTGGTAVAKFVRINAQTGAFLSSDGTYSITSVGNGWYRVSLEITNNSTNTTFNFQAFLTDDTTSTNSIAVWGAQVEAGAFATSYIPTVASTVTRSNDAASMTGTNFSSWYRADEGTFFAGANVQSIASTTSQNLISVYTSASDYMRLWKWNGASSTMRLSVLAGGSNSVELPVTITAGNRNLYAFGYKRNDFAYDVNAGTIQADTTSNVPNNLNALYIGNQVAGEFLGGTITKIAYYPLRLTNAELLGLTTV